MKLVALESRRKPNIAKTTLVNYAKHIGIAFHDAITYSFLPNAPIHDICNPSQPTLIATTPTRSRQKKTTHSRTQHFQAPTSPTSPPKP